MVKKLIPPLLPNKKKKLDSHNFLQLFSTISNTSDFKLLMHNNTVYNTVSQNKSSKTSSIYYIHYFD